MEQQKGVHPEIKKGDQLLMMDITGGSMGKSNSKEVSIREVATSYYKCSHPKCPAKKEGREIA